MKSQVHPGGFSLIELLVVLSALAMLAVSCSDVYRSHVLRAQRAQAQAVLLEAVHHMQRFYSVNDRFDTTANGDPVTLPRALQLSPPEGKPHHRIVIEAVDAGSYRLAARPEPAGDDKDCGVLTLDHRHVKGAAGGFDPKTVARCWR